jgi:hypothetical protein
VMPSSSSRNTSGAVCSHRPCPSQRSASTTSRTSFLPVTYRKLAVSGVQKLPLSPLPAMLGTRCGPPAEAGIHSPHEDASDFNAVRCSVQYHACLFLGPDWPYGIRVPP